MSKRKDNDGKKEEAKKVPKVTKFIDSSQQTIRSFFSSQRQTQASSGKRFIVKPNIELGIEINCCAIGTKFKI